MKLFENKNTYELNELFLDDDKYLSLGGDALFNQNYLAPFPYDGTNQFDKWLNLDMDTKAMYIYTLLRNIANTQNAHSSYMLMMSILFTRHNHTNKIERTATSSTNYYPPINEEEIDKSYRLILIKKLHDSSVEWGMPRHQILHINPYLHTKQYYKELIDKIYNNKKTSITLKDTSHFKTIGDRLTFLLYLDDMLTNGYTIETISLNVGIDKKQIQREKSFLNEFIQQVKE